jgi:hypothetical protein
MPDHPSHRYYVALIVTLDGDEWMITACDFIGDLAILRRKSELSDPAIGYHGEKRDLPLKEIPVPASGKETVG